MIDRIIEIIRSSRNVDEAKARLIEEFAFSDVQATAIVEMKLRQLTGLEREKLQAEYDDLAKFISYCEDVLASTDMQMEIIKNETMDSRPSTETRGNPKSCLMPTSSIRKISTLMTMW